MTVMTGSTQEPAPPRTLGALDEDHLFATGLSSSEPRPRTRWQRIGTRASVTLHVTALLALIFIPIFTPPDLPERDYIKVLIYDPPPPPPPPLPKGIQSREPLEPETPKPVVEKPEKKPDLVAPIETPTPTKVAELKPEDAVSPDEQFGSETGSEFGVPEGMEEGVDGGQLGGIPGGVLGGVLGGTGTGPVLDYDAPPRPIKITKPQYPQEAFIKKIEGVVTCEILIDATGRVVRARVIQSVPMLDAAALQTVYQWVFQPALKRGRPVATIAHAPVTFRIY